MEYLAHIRKSDAKKQFLHEHLADVAEISGRFASKIGLEKYGKITGLLHDLGKYFRMDY
jgi:HD-GYP domain-containing protein (c-di-GMP phosphodiesterase class II)